MTVQTTDQIAQSPSSSPTSCPISKAGKRLPFSILAAAIQASILFLPRSGLDRADAAALATKIDDHPPPFSELNVSTFSEASSADRKRIDEKSDNQ